MAELKFIFTGTPGAGKTTAITAISDVPPVSTDMETTDELHAIKEKTTVAMDFGQLTLADGERVFLYGTPGQERFRYMWEILVRGGLGLVLPIDNSRPDPIEDMTMYLGNFRDFIERTGAVIAVTRSDVKPEPRIEEFQDALTELGMVLPIMHADPRSRDDVLMLLDMLISVVELSQSEYDVDGTNNEQYDALQSL
jgi:signal recognition particle receptor subunit beta